MGREKAPPLRPLILVDSREQRPLRFSAAVDTQSCKLDCGDYSIAQFAEHITLERKSVSDLVQTLSKGRERFEAELDLMQQYRWRAIIVEGRQDEIEIGAYRSLMLPQAVVGSLDAIWMRWGVPTFWCGDAAGAARKVEWFAFRLHRKHPELRLGHVG